jgi:ABC-type branched-subunit amino acid transport system substrate-binding protein
MLIDQIAAINQAGGIAGHKIVPILLNDECKPDAGVANANRFISQDRVHLVIGSGCSSVTLPILDLLTKAGIPLLNPQSTDDRITQKGSDWVFRVAVSERFYRGVRAKYMKEHAGSRVAYIYTNDAAGQAFAKGLMQYMSEAYKAEPIFQVQMQEADLDFRPALLRIKSLNPDAIAIAGQGEALARMLKQSPASDEGPVPKLAGDAVVGLIYAGAFSYTEDRPEVQAFRQMVKTTYKLSEPNFPIAMTYDTIAIAKQALERAHLGLTDESLADDRRAIRDSLTQVHDFKGVVLGPVNFCAAPTPQCRDGNRTALLITYVKGGENFAVKVIGQETLPADAGLPK